MKHYKLNYTKKTGETLDYTIEAPAEAITRKDGEVVGFRARKLEDGEVVGWRSFFNVGVNSMEPIG